MGIGSVLTDTNQVSEQVITEDIVETEQRLIYELTVGDGDYGKVIGKSGRNISALRTLVFAINAKQGGKRARLDVID